jgi:catechol 2,3-dioxygenase-like lactoylglutathione lyase family enzyme
LDRSFTPFDVRAGQKGISNNPFGPDTSQVLRQHLAFEVPKERFHEAVQMLKKSGVHITDFFGKETEEGSVHPWMPIVSVYFSDPDGHVLELLSKLPDEPQPDCYPRVILNGDKRLKSE